MAQRRKATVTTVTIERELPAARTKLHDAISNLIDPRPQTHDGHTAWISPRYHELRDALDSQRIGARHKPQSQPPAWLDAIDLLRTIDHRARQLEPQAPIAQCDDYPTVQRLRFHGIRTWRPQDVTMIVVVTNDLAGFTADIDKLFAQPPKYLPDPCPHCNHLKATRTLDGETIRTPALQITDTGANCLHCHAHWEPDRLMFLGKLLGYRIEGITE